MGTLVPQKTGVPPNMSLSIFITCPSITKFFISLFEDTNSSLNIRTEYAYPRGANPLSAALVKPAKISFFVNHTNEYLFMNKAAATRQTILEKAFEIIYKKGYQTTSIDEIIATTKVTKGAFYYHFKTKDEMGLAIINEIIRPTMQIAFVERMQNGKNPIKEIYSLIKSLLFDNSFLTVECGCPVGNLAQEMTPWNPIFGKAISEIISEWQLTLEKIIQNAADQGIVRKDINPQQVAYFVISGYWGIRSFGKIYNNDDCYHPYLKELKTYLNNLK